MYCEQLKLKNLKIFNNLKFDKMKAKLYYLILILVLAPLMCVQAQICDDPLINNVLFGPYAEMPDSLINYQEGYKSLSIAYIIQSSF